MMLSKIAIALAAIGVTGCVSSTSESAICDKAERPAMELYEGLSAHPETPDAVGEPAVDLLVIIKEC